MVTLIDVVVITKSLAERAITLILTLIKLQLQLVHLVSLMVQQRQNFSLLRNLFQEKRILPVQAIDEVDAVEKKNQGEREDDGGC